MDIRDALSTTTSGFVENTTQVIGNFPLEVGIFTGLFIFFFFVTLRLGRAYTLALALSFFLVGFFFHGFFDIQNFLTRFIENNNTIIIIESILFFLTLLFVTKTVRENLEVDFDSSGLKKTFERVFVSVVLVIISLIFFYKILSISSIYIISPQLAVLFSDSSFFWWLLGSFAGLMILMRR